MKCLHNFDRAYNLKYVVESRGSNGMSGKRIRKLQQGQGLVEYGLILVLVALVVIVAAFLVGQATQRIYGIILGSTGGKADSGNNLQIVAAWCIGDSGLTGTGPYRTGL